MGERRGDRDVLVDFLIHRGGKRSGIVEEHSLGRFPFRCRDPRADVERQAGERDCYG